MRAHPPRPRMKVAHFKQAAQLLFEAHERRERFAPLPAILAPGTAEEAYAIQDAFVAFTLSRPDLTGIENLDGYLRGMLRKLQVSRVRRAAQGAQVTRSLLDQDSAELALRAVGAATVEATQELAMRR